MSFPRYPAYKPSGVEWLGEVPEHWEVLPLKRRSRLLTEKTDSKDNTIALENIEGWTGRFVDTESDFQGEGVAFQAGDILFGKLRPYLAKVFLAESRGQAVGDFHVISPINKLDPKFLQFQLLTRELIDIVSGSTYGAKMPRASWDFLSSLHLALPPVDEQNAIAAFLDRETAKIDALIAEQQRLIELLQEKRQAVISHAVTKGLNPDAPMKDSGVEWLGEVPEHWEVRKISQLFVGIGSGTTPKSDEIEYYEDGDIPWVVTGDLNDELLESCSNFITGKAMQAHTSLRLYPKGSVAVAMYGATIGKAALFGLEATVNQACCVLPPSVRVNENFLLHFVISAKNHLISLATGGGQPNINQDIVRSLRIPIPEVDEQIEIVENLSKILVELEGLLRLSDRQVLLLQERRSALISAAVTGQIDVRGLAPGAEAA